MKMAGYVVYYSTGMHKECCRWRKYSNLHLNLCSADLLSPPLAERVITHCQHAYDTTGSDILLISVAHTDAYSIARIAPLFCSRKIFAKMQWLPVSQHRNVAPDPGLKTSVRYREIYLTVFSLISID